MLNRNQELEEIKNKKHMAKQNPKYELLPEMETKQMLQNFRGERTGWVLVGPKQYFFPIKFVQEGIGFYNFKAKPDDTWVLSFPRSGTTLTQEMAWLLSNNLDFDTAGKILLEERFPFLEFSMFNHPEVTREFLEINEGNFLNQQLCRKIARPGYEIVAAIPSPRFVKSHFPFSLLPTILDVGCKILYVARNPKDVAVSWFYWNRAVKTQGFISDFPTFWNYFEDDRTPWSPYFAHVKEAWNLKDHPNVLFLFYEEMIHDFPKTIKKVAKFLGKTYDDDEIQKIADHLKIENFRNNRMVNGSKLKTCGIIDDGNFIRKGAIGDWKDLFTEELNERANKWIEKNLRDTDLRFPFSIT